MCLEGTHLSQGISIDIAFCKIKKELYCQLLPITTMIQNQTSTH